MSKNLSRILFPLFLIVVLTGVLSSCEATYPAKTLTQQLTTLVADEEGVRVTCHITGKTLWVYAPLKDLVNPKDVSWNTAGLEKMSKVISDIHRAILSTDAKLDFLGVITTDITNFGLELKTIEYIPDLREAVLEKFSRGEFFSRSVRDVAFNPGAINDTSGGSNKFYDIGFNEFLCLQIIHRTKGLFIKDKALLKIYEIKSTSWSEKFGILKIEVEFLKKKYDLTQREEAIDPLDSMKMIAAQVVKNYNYKDFQAILLTDTFANKTLKLTYDDLKKTKITLPENLE